MPNKLPDHTEQVNLARTPGLYWVQDRDTLWQIGRYHPLGYWLLIGRVVQFSDSHFLRIDTQPITVPDRLKDSPGQLHFPEENAKPFCDSSISPVSGKGPS